MIMPLSKSSKFHVNNKMAGIVKSLAPGLSLKVHVTFCMDNMEYKEEKLIISVNGGQDISVALYGCRDPTKLKGIIYLIIS